MIIRRVEINDLNSIYFLETLCFKDPYPRELLYMFLSLYPELFFVAEINSMIVGYVISVIKPGHIGHIVSLCVHPKFRRKGIGTKLIQSVEETCRKKFNVCKFRLEVRVSNAGAISFYTKLGYSIAFKASKYYPDGEDAYVMIKNECSNVLNSSVET